MNTLTFTFVGNITSNNRVSRRVGRRTIVNPQATLDKNKVGMLALEAKQNCGWVMPEACAVFITAYNSRKDASNIEKCIGDGMNGVVFADDSSIIDLHIVKCATLRANGISCRCNRASPWQSPNPPHGRSNRKRHSPGVLRPLIAYAIHGEYGCIRSR